MRREDHHSEAHDLDFFSTKDDVIVSTHLADVPDVGDRGKGGPPVSAERSAERPVRALSSTDVYFTNDPGESDDTASFALPEENAGGTFRAEAADIGKTLRAETDDIGDTGIEEAGIEESDDRPEPSVFDELNESVEKKRRVRRFVTTHKQKILHKIVMGTFFIIVLFISILALLPIVLTILNSFMDSAEIRNHYSAIYESLSGYTGDKSRFVAQPKLRFVPDMVSVDQYATLLLKTPAYLLKFWNSVLIVVPIVLGQMIVGSLAAFAFARYRRKWSEALFFSYIILMLMPHQVTLVPNLFIADTLNIYNSWWAIILPGVFSTFSVFLLSKYMRQIPTSYIEAAKLDGAGEWHIFWSICLPMCKSALYAMSILLFIDYWNMVEQPLLMLENKDLYPMSVFLSQINQKELGVAFAASTIFMIPPLLMFFNGEEYLIEGISRSGIK